MTSSPSTARPHILPLLAAALALAVAATPGAFALYAGPPGCQPACVTVDLQPGAPGCEPACITAPPCEPACLEADVHAGPAPVSVRVDPGSGCRPQC